MSNNQRGVAYWISAWWPVAISVAVVTISSSDLFSAPHSVHLLQRIVEAIFGPVPGIPWDKVNFWVRKSGHFTGYGLIGLSWLRAWWMTLPHSRYALDAGLSLLGCAAMASLDEWHQSYIPTRTGSPWDVLLDCTGACTMMLVAYILLRIFRPKRLRHQAA